jgi:hypothetical protein
VPKPSPEARYEVGATLQAPLEFVFRWSTDYTPKDSRYSGEGFERRILRRSARRVEFEDLYDTPTGWIWIRRVVRLWPPDHWRADSMGNDRILSVDYRLSELPGDRTQLTIRARRRPFGIGRRNPPKATWERSVSAGWAGYGRALQRDYARGEPRTNSKKRERR